MADIADQVIDALAGKVRVSGGLGENKAALKNRLGMPGETFGSPVHDDPTLLSGGFDVRFKRGCMAEDALRASIPDRGGGVVNLLRHRADEAGVFKSLAADDPLSEIEVRQNAVQRIVRLVIRCSSEQGAGRLSPVIRRRYAKRILRLEVVKERAFRDPCRLAEVIYGSRSEALLADDISGGFKKPRSRIATLRGLFGRSRHS